MEDLSYQLLIVFSIGILGGMLGAVFFRHLRIPQVVGYIVVGVLLGESGLGLIGSDTVGRLHPFTFFALGIIGFLVGGELKIDALRKYGRQYLVLLLSEGLATFLMVSIASGFILYSISHSPVLALAGGIILGAIASATDPASTLDVIWEYRALGALSAAIVAIVALDDILALSLYGLSAGFAGSLTGQGISLLAAMGGIVARLAGSLVLGVLAAFAVRSLLRRMRHSEQALAFVIGLILLLISVALYADLDVILVTMALGLVVVNIAPSRSRELFSRMHALSLPIYTLFFVLVGARLHISHVPAGLWWLVGAYVSARTIGKVLGCYAGARLCHQGAVLDKYLGMGLLAQGGVAVGLSMTAGHALGSIQLTDSLSLGEAVIFAVTASTLFLQLLGPALVKWVIQKTGESGRNLTREDVIASWSAGDVMSDDFAHIQRHQPIAEVIQQFTQHEHLVFPVTDESHRLVGVLSLAMLKDLLPHQHLWSRLIADDVMRPIRLFVVPETPLSEVLDHLHKHDHQFAVVVKDRDSLQPVGIIDKQEVEHAINREILIRHKAKPTCAAGASGCSPYTEEVVPC